ncbi:UNVERIFIED_CONTAM: hypothetical protein GTU68_022223 [Idotea baltica]|nr:hypothetical protein [Idotea baltica]
MKFKSIGIAGITGAVGQEILGLLEKDKEFNGELRIFASKRSEGKEFAYRESKIITEEFTVDKASECELVFFAVSGDFSKENARKLTEKGVYVIDNSSAFRLDDDTPLIVPEVNPNALKKEDRLIANPNCSTIQLLVAVAPLERDYGIERISVATYQAASGAGQQAISELLDCTQAQIAGEDSPKFEKFARNPAFNCIPAIDVFVEDDYTKEETKLIHESRKILSRPELKVTATAVRVPAIRSHSEAVNIQLKKEFNLDNIKESLKNSKGLEVAEDSKEFHTPQDASGNCTTYVGRIRYDRTLDNSLNMWVVADQLLRGAAYNAVEIARII